MREGLAFVLASGIACLSTTLPRSAGATLLDPNFDEAPFAEAGAGVTSMAWAPDASGRLFVTIKEGEVRVLENGQLLPTPFWTAPSVYTTSECGLLSVAFDPLFRRNGWVYVFVTVSSSEQRIVRLTAEGNVGTEPTVIVPGLPTRGKNHDGGAIGFGPDGKLYWSIGDQGAAIGTDEDLTVLASKVGRANKDGSVPNDNPFFDGPGPNNDFIWALGFRNPFTFTWQPSTEKLWMNVVGTNYEQIFEVNAGDNAGWNDWEANQPEPYISPKVAYRTDSTFVRNIATTNGVVRVAGVTTVTTNGATSMRVGQPVTLTGVADPSFNGSGFISSIVSAKKFTMEQAGPDASSGGGVATNPEFGGCITGGAFLDSTSAPDDYFGNFFFGDYNSGRIGRVALDPSNGVRRFEVFGEGLSNPIDFSLGPDGDLYYIEYTGSVTRVRYRATTQRIVVSNKNARLAEGGSFPLGVRLAIAPPGSITVRAARASGASNVTTSTAALTFNPGNWDVAQMVEIDAADDADSVDDLATVSVTSTGLTTESVTVRVTDDDARSLLLSANALRLTEGEATAFDVSLSGPPSAPVVVHVVLDSGDEDIGVVGGDLSFDVSNWSVPQTVGVEAAPDDDSGDDMGTLRVSADGFGERAIPVTVIDDDPLAPAIVSEPVLTAVVDADYVYQVESRGRPNPEYALTEAPSGMSVDSTSGLVTWTPSETGSFAVELEASNGVEPNALQRFEIEVVTDLAPECSLDQPHPDEVISGAEAEFYGDVQDDVGAVKGEFWIDGKLVYTDETPGGHYHVGGEHHLFDTTVLDDGPHVLELKGYDTAGKTCSAEVAVTVRNRTGGEGGAGGQTGHPDAGAESAGAPSASGGSGAGGFSTGGEAGAPETTNAGAPSGGTDGSDGDDGDHSDSGCSCRTTPRSGGSVWLLALVSFVAVARRRRRPAHRESPSSTQV